MKRTLCLFLALILAVGICFSAPVTITASAAAAESDFEYEENDGGITIYGYRGSDSEIVIPDTIDGKPVTIIDDIAFYECTALTSVTLPEGLTSIGDMAFYGCTSLETVKIGNGVETIGVRAFSGCTELTEIIIPDSVKSIGVRAFYGCTSLKTVKIGNGVETIGKETFSGCIALTSVTMGTSVKTIGNSAFADCESLGEITIPDGVETIGDSAFYYCSSLETVTIPKSVTTIGSGAFYGIKSTATVSVPCKWNEQSFGTAFKGVTVTIAPHEYENGVCVTCGFNCEHTTYKDLKCAACGISCIHETVTDGVCEVCGGTYCGKTESDTVVYFYNESTKTLTISGEGAMADFTDTTMPWYSYRSEIATIVINKGVTSIGAYSFYYCTALTSVTIPESVTTICNAAFSGCTSLTTIKIPNSVTTIGESAFSRCTSLTSVTIPYSVTSIDMWAFSSCTSLTSVTIPYSVTSIGIGAFNNCTKLTTVSAPCSWNEKPLYTFGDGVAVNIERHTLENNTCTVCEGGKCGATESDTVTWFYDEGTLYINGTGAMKSSSTTPWENYKSEITTVVIGSGVTTIGSYAFDACTNLATVTIPESVTTIGDYAFRNCTSLPSVTIPESVTTIGINAFNGCTSLTKIEIPNSVTTIEGATFYNCTALKTVEIPDSVTTIGKYAFDTCTALKTVNVPCSWNEKPLYTFNEGVEVNITKHTIVNNNCTVCKGSKCGKTESDTVTWVYDEGTLYINGTGAMANYNGSIYSYNAPWYENYRNNIKTIVIEKGVTTIGSSAFEGCTSLTTVTIPESVTTIDDKAFVNCTKITTVNVPCSWNEKSLYNFNFNGGVKVNFKKHTIVNNNCTVCKGSKCGATESDTVTWIYDEGTLYINGTGAMKSSSTTPWENYKSEITTVVIGNGVTTIGAKAFSDCTKLATVTIPNGVTTIGANAFDCCRNLATVTISNSVTTIGSSAFNACTSLTTITIPSSVTSIGELAFNACTLLTTVTIPGIETTIGMDAFKNCTSLSTVNVPCNWNGSIYNFEESILEIADHDTTKTATCISKAECSVCGEYGDFANHTPAENATYTDNGDGTHSFECTVCGTVTESHTFTDDTCTVCEVIGGYCGATENDNVIWSFDDSDGTLTISGSGAMADYGLNNIPWGNYKSSITQINIENGVTTIAEFAFANCISLTSVTIPDSVTTIGGSAFRGCIELISITIPENVTAIGSYAFDGCAILASISVDDANTKYSSEDGVLFNKDKTELICYPTGQNAKSYTILDSVITIGEDAFKNCTKLTSVTIPDSVTTIGESAFYGCSRLASVTIPKSATTIGDYAFYGCSELTSVTIPGIETTIGDNAFSECPKVTLLVKEYSNAHAYASENNIKYITYVGGSGELGKLTFTPIYEEADNENSEITGYSVTTRDTSISGALTIPSKYNGYSVTAIGDNAFSNCTSLTSVEIPYSVETIGENAFKDCSENLLLLVKGGSALEEYAKIQGIVYISFAITNEMVNNAQVSACSKLITGSLTIPSKYNDCSVTAIGDSAFRGCTALTSVTIPESVTTIGDSAFRGCTALTSATIPKSVTTIGDSAFRGCTALTSATIPSSVTTIGANAFSTCEKLTEIIIPASVTSIDAEAFFECSNLKYIFFEGTEDSQKTIGDALVTNAKIHYGSSTHTFNENYTVDVEPTCTEKGSESQHCKYCDLTQNERPVKENGHTSVNGGTEKAHTICDVCEEVLSATHNPTSKVTTAPTCTEEGVETLTCECGYTYTKPVAKLGHDIVSHSAKSATCEAIGWYAYDTCSRCDYTTYKEIAKLGHDIVIDKAVAPTCTKTGLTEGQHCTRCDDKTVAQEVVPALNHKGTLVQVEAKAPTCETIGWDAYEHCTACDYTTYKEKAKLGHDKVSHSAKSATCEAIGWYAYDTCSRCDYTTYKEIAKLGHDIVIDKAVEATCTKTGLTEGSHCTRCNGATVAQNVVDATGHKLTLVGKKEPTFKAEGHTGSEVCSVCNEIINVGSVIKKLSFTTPEVTAVANKSGIKVNWNKVENAERYVLYKRVYDASAEKWSKWKIINADLTTLDYLDTDVVLGAKYRYTVRAKNGDTLSEYKSTSTVKYNVTPTVKVANATGGIKVSWSTVANATGYRVYRSTLSNGKWSNWKNMGTAAANKTSWTDKSVKSDVTYKYTVRAVYNKVLSSYNKNGASVLFLTAPTVKIANVSNGVKVTWNKITGASGYYVYSAQYDPSTKKWSGWTNRGTVTKTSWTDKKVESGVKYRYTVRAIKGKTLSAYKATSGLIYLLEPTVKIANASTGIKVTWSQCDGATGYTVYRSEYNTKTKKWSKWKNRGTAAATKSSWTDKYVTSGKNYKYTVRAVNGDFKSSYVSSDKLLYLAQPKVTVKAVSNGINVAWSKSAGAKGYIVYRSELVNGEWSKWKNMGTAKAEKSSWTDKSAKAGVTYKYTVRAVNNGVKSSYKASTSVVR